MHPRGANQDDRSPMTPAIDDPATVAHPSGFLPEPGGASSEEDSSSQSPPSPPRRRRDRQKHACTALGCMMKFDRPSALKQHLLSHTGEKPHHCEVCGRGFSTASNMRRHIPSCPVRRRQSMALRASRTNQDGHLALPGSSFAPHREQTQTFEPGWPSSSRNTPSHWGSGIPQSSTPMPMYSPPSGGQSALPSPYTPNDGSTWRRTSTPDVQHEASFQHSRPFLEPSYEPHPPTFPRISRTPYEPGPLQRPSPSDTISPRENTSMRWSPGSTVGGARDSQSRLGSMEDLRFSSTPALQRYPSDFASQLHLPDLQGSRSQMPSSATGTPSLVGSLPLIAGESTTPESVQPQVQQAPAFIPMFYGSRSGGWGRRRDPRGLISPGQGSAQWHSSSQPSPAPPYEAADNPGSSTGERSNRDHEFSG